jgi:thiol-disulfide isomerase/thioredoxin
MKVKCIHLLLLLLFYTSFGYTQSPEEVLENYYKAISDLEYLSYRINNIDTFLNGSVWNKSGACLLKRKKDLDLFGFQFRGKMDGRDDEIIFYGDELYEINHKNKAYKIQKDEIHRGILGHPNGQTVLNELVEKIIGFNKLSLAKTDSSFILRFDFPFNQEFQIRNRFKELHLNRKNYLPFYRYHSLESFGDKQVNIAYLSTIKINELEADDPFLNKDFLKDYTYESPKNFTDHRKKLLENKASDFELFDLFGTEHVLSHQKGKVILLDFWEVWCAPCLESISKLKELSNKYKQDNFEIWSIVSDESTFKKVKEVIQKKAIDYKVLFGNVKTSNDYFLREVPLYILIDRGGIVRYINIGTSAQIEEEILKYLN